MAKIFVVPIEGREVINPATGKPIPAGGIEVEESNWWNRRLRHGEVTFGEKKPARKPPARRKKDED